jgi:hypothetical protein
MRRNLKMLQKKSVGKPLWDILKTLQKDKTFEKYFLVGGTALSLQIGHRILQNGEPSP